MKKQIYLAGAMSCYGEKQNEAKKWRDEAKKWFKSNSDNFKCVSPVDYFYPGSGNFKTESEVMRFDLQKVKESNIVLVNLKDLNKSIGTTDEILYAYLHDIPVIGFLEPLGKVYNGKDIEKIIHPWKFIQINRIEYCGNAMEEAMKYIVDFYS